MDLPADSMTFPPCQLCGAAPASCRSHIIPKQFYKRIRGTEKHLFELHVEKGIERRFTQSGIWEQNILCPACDRKLGVFDDYAYEVLPENIEQTSMKHLGQGISVYDLGLIDADKFRKFLVALIWRSARSRHEMFRFMRIGPYEKRFEGVLTGNDPSWLRHVDCVFVYFKPARYDKILLPPFHNKCGSVNVVQFYLPPWKLLIKLDSRPFEVPFAQTALKAGVPTYALMMASFSRGELRMLADLQQKIRRYEIARNTRTRQI